VKHKQQYCRDAKPAGDSGNDGDQDVYGYSTQADDSADIMWTWPNNAENKSFTKEYFLADTHNGYKPFYQSTAAFYFQDVGWPEYNAGGKLIHNPSQASPIL
jgi:hypothetical protein